MRRTKEEAEVTRQKLMDAALQVFCQKGYADTRLEDVALQANVTRGAIYHHFGGKVELYDALVNERFARAGRTLQQVIAQGGTPLEVLRRVSVRSLEFLEEDQDYRIVQELVLFKTSFAPELEHGIRAKIESTQAQVRLLAGFIQAGIDAGEIKAHVQPEDAALALLGLLNGVSMLWLMDPGSFSLKDRAAAIVNAALEGIVVE